ncbi:MAG: HIT family protein [Candidatus Rokuibacteriota bacterium]
MNRLWAPWRMAYLGSPAPAPGCIFCDVLAASDDRRGLLLYRGARAFLILNLYPYASGHLMAVLNRHVGRVADAGSDELAEAMRLVQRGTAALRTEYRPDGFNVGLNEGRAAGAGIADHLHVHIVPRWNGDSNFMPVVGETRVLPESLETTYDRLARRLHD